MDFHHGSEESEVTNQTQLLPVAFDGDQLFIVNHGGEPYVPMRPVVEGMGLAWQPQHAKLMADKERFCVTEIVTQMPGDDQRRSVICLPLRRLFGWLMTISPNKVKPILRQKIIRYQRECDDVLWRYWSRQTEQLSRLELGPLFSLTREELGHNVQSLNASLVLQWLVSNQTEQKGIEISVRELASETGVSRTGICRSLTALEQMGLLNWQREVSHGPGRIKVLKGTLNKALAKPVRRALN